MDIGWGDGEMREFYAEFSTTHVQPYDHARRYEISLPSVTKPVGARFQPSLI